MATDEERCAEARQLERIDAAFREGDLGALREAVGDAAVPNGPMPLTIGSCLVHAIYRSPLAFIRTLLEIGADPNAPADDGFPPLIAALSCAREVPGATRRTDVDEILRLLLSFGADPDQRGLNDYTPLHMAVAERNAMAVQILLDGGANPALRTRIDEYETPLQMAESAGLAAIASMLAHAGQPLRRRLRPGLIVLADVAGDGEPVRRQHHYRLRMRLWLDNGERIRWPGLSVPPNEATVDDPAETFVVDQRINRGSLINGVFYGVDGMRVGGWRRLEIAPHLAYGDRGVPGVIPPGARIIAEVMVLEGPRQDRRT